MTLSAPIRWFGGKSYLAGWILDHFPPPDRYRVYVEPFGGAASVLFRKPPHDHVEIYNDLDGRLVNLFRVLQDQERARSLYRRLKYTLYSRAEFVSSVRILRGEVDPKDEIDLAWAFFVACNSVFSGLLNRISPGNWSKSLSNQKPLSFANKVKRIKSFHSRLKSVFIENRDAHRLISEYDSPETLFYIDPPYAPSTRTNKKYAFDVTDEFHRKLVELLLSVKGRVLLSGYDCEIYNVLDKNGWTRSEKIVPCHSVGNRKNIEKLGGKKTKRKEVLWMNFLPPGKEDCCAKEELPLFAF